MPSSAAFPAAPRPTTHVTPSHCLSPRPAPAFHSRPPTAVTSSALFICCQTQFYFLAPGPEITPSAGLGFYPHYFKSTHFTRRASRLPHCLFCAPVFKVKFDIQASEVFRRQEPRLRQEALCRTSLPAPSPPPHHPVPGAHPSSEVGDRAQSQDLSKLIHVAPCSFRAGPLSVLPLDLLPSLGQVTGPGAHGDPGAQTRPTTHRHG